MRSRVWIELIHFGLSRFLSFCASNLQQYEEWKKNLPDTDWIKGLIPVIEADKFRTGISKAADGIKGKANEIDLDPALR